MGKPQPYSQYGQDRIVLRHFYGAAWEDPPGDNSKYFVEVGAHDGRIYSNTLAMEELGWNGICIEPNPLVLDDLRNNRKCIIDESCVYSENGKVVEFLASSAASSGINNDETVAMIKKNFNRNMKKGRATVVNKKTKTLTSILDYHDAPSIIDYLSVDVEGQEIHVINGIDFDKYKFRVLSVEINNHDIDELVRSKGYKFLVRKRVDRIYVCEELL